MKYRLDQHGWTSSFRATRHAPRATRAGFTLIEMMVAMALTMFIMVILSEAFATGLDTFSQLKAIGDMEENLRAAATSLRTDLAADHFNAKRRLSDPDFYTNPPTQGFVRIAYSATGAVTPEGMDGNLVPSWRSTQSVLYLTVKRRGNQRGDFFTAGLPAGSPLLTVQTNFFNQAPDGRRQDTPNTYNCQWAEVAYYLVLTGSTIEPNPTNVPTLANIPAGATPLYALYRVQRVLVADNTAINFGTTIPSNATTQAAYSQMSWNTRAGILYFNTPGDMIYGTAALATVNKNFGYRSFYFTTQNTFNVPANFTLDSTKAAGLTNLHTSTGGRGAALLMSNVISFDVRVLRAGSPQANPANQTYPDADLQQSDLKPDFAQVNFDSAIAPAAIAQFFILGVSASLRVWDLKTRQARQITVLQDM